MMFNSSLLLLLLVMVMLEFRSRGTNQGKEGKTNEAEWSAHIEAVGADYLDSAVTANEEIKDNENPLAAATGSFV